MWYSNTLSHSTSYHLLLIITRNCKWFGQIQASSTTISYSDIHYHIVTASLLWWDGHDIVNVQSVHSLICCVCAVSRERTENWTIRCKANIMSEANKIADESVWSGFMNYSGQNCAAGAHNRVRDAVCDSIQRPEHISELYCKNIASEFHFFVSLPKTPTN